MEATDGSEYILRKLLDFDKLCFNYCIKVPEKKFTTKDEVCLSYYSFEFIFILFIRKLHYKSTQCFRIP